MADAEEREVEETEHPVEEETFGEESNPADAEYEEYRGDEDEHEEEETTHVKTLRFGIEVAPDGEPIMPTSLATLCETGGKFDTGDSALMVEYQKQIKQFSDNNKKLKEKYRREAGGRSEKSQAHYDKIAYEKLANSPKFGKTCQFNPEDQTGNAHKEPVEFIEEFEAATQLMTNDELKVYYFRAHTSPGVRKMFIQEDKKAASAGKSPLKYKNYRQLILKKYATQAYQDKLYKKADEYKQGKNTMQTYFTNKSGLLDELKDHGCEMSNYTRRSSMLKGARQDIVKLAQNEPAFRGSNWEVAARRLCALDEANPISAAMTAINSLDIQKLISGEVKNQVKQTLASMNSKYNPDNKKKRKRDNDRSEGDDKKPPFSQGKMRLLYTEAQWTHRMQCIKDKVPPGKYPELYENDVHPVDEAGTGPGPGAQPACVFCRKLGHTVVGCKGLEKRNKK